MSKRKKEEIRATYSELVSATKPDWNREKCRRFWDPSRQLVKSIRGYQSCQEKNDCLRKLRSKWFVLQHRFWSVVTGADIPLNCKLGGGILIPHPNGIVIHPGAVIGPNCLIFQQVTIVGGVEIGGHVDIGAGAKIIKPIKIGDHTQIGANAVVLQGCPEKDIVAGIPAISIRNLNNCFLK